MFKRACEQGIYEWDNLQLLYSVVTPESVFFDVGANIGLMSIPVLSRCDSCTVVSFESSPSTLKHLLRTARWSAFRDRWHVVGKVVGREGPTPGHQPQTETLTTGISHTNLDTEWMAMGKPRVSAIKITAQGAEAETLEGAKHCILSERPHILLEWHPVHLRAYDRPPASLFLIANRFRYRIYSLPCLVPITDAITLRVHMLKSASFLLTPGEQKLPE